MKYEIKSWLNGDVLFSIETDSFKLALEAAVKSGANLSGANLSRADLSGADLTRADLSGADLSGATLTRANLSGAEIDWQVLEIGPVGSRNAYLVYKRKGDVEEVMTGCFRGTLAAFEAAVQQQHGDNKHGQDYRKAIAFIRSLIPAEVTAS